MATAFKKPNLSQSVKTPEPIAETQSFDDLWSGDGETAEQTAEQATNEVTGEVSEEVGETPECDPEFATQDPEAMAEMTGEETAVKEAIEQATEEGNAPDQDWTQTDQVELGLVADPIVDQVKGSIFLSITNPPSRTALDDLLDEISNAHLACTEAAAEVFHAESAVKAAKAAHKLKEENYNQRVEVLLELTSKITHDSNRPLFPLTKPTTPAAPAPTAAFTSPTEATDVSPDSGQVVSDATSDPTTEEALPEWQSIELLVLEQHGVSATLIEKLAENGINTLGELESLRAEISQGKAKWPKGIGEKKITAIENAVVTLLAKHQYSDSTNVPVTKVDDADSTNEDTSDVGDNSEDSDTPEIDASSEPTNEEWDAMSHGEQIGWLNARAVYLDDQAAKDKELSVVDVLDYRNTDSEVQWQEGVDSYSEDDTASNCPYGPGEDCDAWLQGWLWAGKQDTFDTSLPPKE